MNLKKQLATKNECYIRGDKMKPIGIVVHSTGANNPALKRYVQPDDGLLGKNIYNNSWNNFRPGGRQICCHAFIGKLASGAIATYQILPWETRGWHAGSGKKGSANDGYIGFEICEDNTQNASYVKQTYQEAVDFCAHLVKLYPAIKYENIIGHYEAAARGIASNHADPQHWWKKHKLSMDQFRKDVRSKVEAEAKPKPVPATEYVVKKGDTLWAIAKEQLHDANKWQEIARANNIKAPYTIRAGQVLKLGTATQPTQPKTYKVRITAKAGLNYRSGPGTNYAKHGAFNYGQTVTISKEQLGWGYVTGKGWIALRHTKRT